jgi:hypothetical protein
MRQIIDSDHGEWSLAVARHRNAETFTFDMSVPASHVYDLPPKDIRCVHICHNMTRADLEEHVRQCAEVLAEVPSHVG